MKSSDDEAEALPLPVSNYHFVDDNYEPVSFSVLPIQWDEDERIGGEKVRVFLHGSADNGLQMIFMHVIAWKFELSNERPEILVLSKDNTWIKLQKPKKSFEDIVRSVLVTVHSLHFLMRKPEASGETLWAHIFKLFSLHEEKPFQIDLEDHLCLISEACRRNAALAKSKLLGKFVNKNPKTRKKPDEDSKAKTVSKFVVSKKDAVVDVSEEHKSSESRDIYDDACAFCDEGGDLLCCEGRCMRSFHATVKAATTANSNCDSLGLTEDEVNAIPNFLCRNCEYKQHQCFICGMLGSSDTTSGAAQVFGCASATCGRFYHPHCVSKLFHQDNKDSVEALEKKIVEGRSFMCPIHKCCICKQGENKKDPDWQFAVCRRCPKSYHRKCLPRKIAFKENKKEGIVIRAWTDVLSDRILMYCLEHEMDERIGTPTRDHIKFPNVEEKKNVTEKRKASVEEKKRSHTSSNSSRDSRKIELKMRIPASKEHNHGTTACETLEQNAKPSSAVKVRGNKDMGEHCSQPNIPVRVHVNDASKKELKSPVDRENKSLLKPGKKETTKTVPNQSEEVEAMTKILSSSLPQLDADTERSLMDLMEDAASSINPEDIRGKDGVPSTHTSSLKDIVNGTVIMEKLESLAQEVRTASHIPENGGCIEDAKAVCKPELLSKIYKWKIVNKLHCYVQEGDTIVDICCGDNDFGLLMKNKLEEMGRKCLYENYNIVQDKNDINSEKRDWMTVQLEDLPTGTKLIMALNISSGVEAALANKFIDKALEFRPKLLLLILPQEAQRLGENIPPYCLIWEDSHLLSGKSFYSSGYVNTNEKQTEQSNVMPHVLYLWSRIDWSSTHKYIAERYCHISTQQELVEKSAEHTIANHPTRDSDNYDTKLNPTNEFLGHESHKSYEHRNTKSEKKHGGEEVETARESKSEIWSHPEYGGHNHWTFGNRVPASPMQSGTSYDGKRARTLEDEFTRYNMSTAEHGTGRYGETASFHSRQHINESEEKPKNESNMWSGIADGGKRARTLDEKFRRHNMHADEHRTDHYAQAISVSNRQQINGNEGKPRKESNIWSPVSIHEQKDSYSSGSNHPAGHNAGHNLMGSITLSSPSSRHWNSASEPSYPINALGMQHLPTDELKNRRSSFYDAPELPGHPGVPMGFAPGPNEAYSLHHTAGWIDE